MMAFGLVLILLGVGMVLHNASFRSIERRLAKLEKQMGTNGPR